MHTKKCINTHTHMYLLLVNIFYKWFTTDQNNVAENKIKCFNKSHLHNGICMCFILVCVHVCVCEPMNFAKCWKWTYSLSENKNIFFPLKIACIIYCKVSHNARVWMCAWAHNKWTDLIFCGTMDSENNV